MSRLEPARSGLSEFGNFGRFGYRTGEHVPLGLNGPGQKRRSIGFDRARSAAAAPVRAVGAGTGARKACGQVLPVRLHSAGQTWHRWLARILEAGQEGDNLVASELQTRTGQCATHGAVEATREVPRPSFPFVVYAVRRLIATRRQFRCPTCGAPVASG